MRQSPEQRRARRRALYQERKLDGRCVHCNAGLQEDDGVTCVECTEKDVALKFKRLQTRAGKLASQRRVNARRARHALAGKCRDCGRARSPRSRWHCEACLEKYRIRKRMYAKRVRAGVVRRDIKPASANTPHKEPHYYPLDELKKQPRVRIILALSRFDWITTRELFELLELPAFVDGGANLERDAYLQHVTRLVRDGFAERRGTHGSRDYRLTATGMAEARRLRGGDLVMRRRAA